MTVAAAVGVLGRCQDPIAPDSRIAVVDGAGITDTIFALLEDSLVVRIRGAGAGTTVRFEAVELPGRLPWPPYDRALLPTVAVGVGVYPSAQWFETSTDADGYARTRVRLGTRAGRAGVVVSVPELGLVDTAWYTVQPGELVDVRLEKGRPVLIAAIETLRIEPVDRGGNALELPVSLVTSAPGIITVASDRVTGVVPGQASIFATVAGRRYVLALTVLPDAWFVAVDRASPQFDVVHVRIDGEHRREAGVVHLDNAGPTKDPLAERVIFFNGAVPGAWWLLESTFSGIQRIELPESFVWAAWPRFSSDGDSIWFEGRRGTGCVGLWRADRDFSAIDSIRTYPGRSVRLPRVSPDGRYVAALLRDCGDATGDLGLRVMDLQGLQQTLEGSFSALAWSPSSDRLAVADNTAGVTRILAWPGLEDTGLGPFPMASHGGLDWSPDGRWIIIANHSSPAHLHEVGGALDLETGMNPISDPEWQ